MAAPEEVLAFPMDLFVADVGSSFPDVTDLVADFDPAWAMLGKEASANEDDSGVTLSLAETVLDFRPAGRTNPVKRFRTGETIGGKVNIVDWSAVTVGQLMNNAVQTPSGHFKRVSLYRGPKVAQYALLGRTSSGEDNDLNMQLCIPKTFISVNGDSVFTIGTVSMLPVEFLASIQVDADFPYVDIQTSES
jgi:hypothetical protein